MADTLRLGRSAERRGSSSLPWGTKEFFGGMGLLGVVASLAPRIFRSVRIRYSPP